MGVSMSVSRRYATRVVSCKKIVLLGKEAAECPTVRQLLSRPLSTTASTVITSGNPRESPSPLITQASNRKITTPPKVNLQRPNTKTKPPIDPPTRQKSEGVKKGLVQVEHSDVKKIQVLKSNLRNSPTVPQYNPLNSTQNTLGKLVREKTLQELEPRKYCVAKAVASQKWKPDSLSNNYKRNSLPSKPEETNKDVSKKQSSENRVSDSKPVRQNEKLIAKANLSLRNAEKRSVRNETTSSQTSEIPTYGEKIDLSKLRRRPQTLQQNSTKENEPKVVHKKDAECNDKAFAQRKVSSVPSSQQNRGQAAVKPVVGDKIKTQTNSKTETDNKPGIIIIDYNKLEPEKKPINKDVSYDIPCVDESKLTRPLAAADRAQDKRQTLPNFKEEKNATITQPPTVSKLEVLGDVIQDGEEKISGNQKFDSNSYTVGKDNVEISGTVDPMIKSDFTSFENVLFVCDNDGETNSKNIDHYSSGSFLELNANKHAVIGPELFDEKVQTRMEEGRSDVSPFTRKKPDKKETSGVSETDTFPNSSNTENTIVAQKVNDQPPMPQRLRSRYMHTFSQTKETILHNKSIGNFAIQNTDIIKKVSNPERHLFRPFGTRVNLSNFKKISPGQRRTKVTMQCHLRTNDDAPLNLSTQKWLTFGQEDEKKSDKGVQTVEYLGKIWRSFKDALTNRVSNDSDGKKRKLLWKITVKNKVHLNH